MKFFRSSFFPVFLLLTLSACNAPDDQGANAFGEVVGTDTVTGTPQPIPDDPDNGSGPANPDADPGTRIGQTCHSDDPSKICLALKYVVYRDSSDDPLVSEIEAITNVSNMNTLWSQCDIAFEIGEYAAVNPADYDFDFNTSSKTDLAGIRNTFEDDKTLLIVTTGSWTGTLGALSTNAWTMMPGTSTNGVVVEAGSRNSYRLLAHELGHYLNLDHYSSTSNMMNPVIYTTSTSLTSSQCTAARNAAKYYWSAMYR